MGNLSYAMRKASSQVAYEFANAPVNTHADKLACVMSFIRSAEKGHVVNQIRNATRYEHLRSLIDPSDPFLREKPSLNHVRDHAVELASLDISARLQQLRGTQGSQPTEYQHKKEQLLVRLKE